ncbi:MAG TPA: hypothetical protein ENG87_01830 [Candidatus Pacearchaeota archaeon]|nr:hypothetical protein BMS3Abin17_00114 [archaeon BMS3Abin17]HDK42092.1 hypothetical protein [Candidatus Pacearchaeota archaeon]HDZ60144.1 hypothetical protein [Candidatus Pacearchaeota archaeon]
MKFKLGKRQIKILFLFGISSTIFYYANQILQRGGDFSDGILAGFLIGLVFVLSLAILYLWGEMLYLNWKVRVKKC